MFKIKHKDTRTTSLIFHFEKLMFAERIVINFFV